MAEGGQGMEGMDHRKQNKVSLEYFIFYRNILGSCIYALKE